MRQVSFASTDSLFIFLCETIFCVPWLTRLQSRVLLDFYSFIIVAFVYDKVYTDEISRQDSQTAIQLLAFSRSCLVTYGRYRLYKLKQIQTSQALLTLLSGCFENLWICCSTYLAVYKV